MSDRRKDVLYSVINNHPTHGLGDEEEKIAIEAMDEYMKEVCLELIRWLLNHGSFASRFVNGERLLYYRGDYITPEQLFENFL